MRLPQPLIIYKYLLRNAIVSTVTQIGLLFGVLLAGAVVVETVFDWPGIGIYAVNATTSIHPGASRSDSTTRGATRNGRAPPGR